MLADIREYLSHYLVLAILLGAGLILFALNVWNPPLQRIITVVIASSYILWGIIHHRISDQVTKKIVLEYAIIAALAVILIYEVIRQ